MAWWIWQVPAGRFSRGPAALLLGNWEVNGIWSAYSGPPLQFSTSQDRSLRAHPNRPDRIKDPRLSTDRPRAELVSEDFDRTAFVPNRIGEFGNAPRAEGQLQGPGDIDLMVGLQKRFPGFAESHQLQFRAEFFNALNRPNFGAPGTNPDAASSYGRITSGSDGRIIQFGLKYLF